MPRQPLPRQTKALAAPESTKDALGISFYQLRFELPKSAKYTAEMLPETVRMQVCRLQSS